MGRKALRRPRLLRSAAAAMFAVLMAATAAMLGAGIASAHSAIVEMSPPDGSAVDSGPDRVTLTFNEAISPDYANLTVVGPDGNLWSRGEPTVSGNTISVPVGELGPAGTYTVAVKVTSADGHVVGYTRSFELTQPGDGTPGPKADASDADDGSDSSGGVQWWWFVIPAVVLFGGGLWFALRGSGDDD
ncbi:copper resistance protein CopC [Tomitella gaofuii]|uniref:copper resistance CopC family protein n=1 Tax=Tomitella gaofuii TaxID=2760083 RepID=UPI0039A52FC1